MPYGGERTSAGWVELLGGRLSKCYRCFATGHVWARYPNTVDSSLICLNCGEAGHMVSECISEAWCNVCAERGLPAGHRADGRKYPPWAPTKKMVKHPRIERVLHQKKSNLGRPRPRQDEEEPSGSFREDCLSPGHLEDAREMTPEERKKKKKRRKIEEDADKTAGHHRRAAIPLDEAMEAETETAIFNY